MANLSPEAFEEIWRNNPSLQARNPNLFSKPSPKAPVQSSESKKQPKANKYRNVKVYVHEDGYVAFQAPDTNHGKVKETYDSAKEYRRWLELQILQKAGSISDLHKQVKLVIQEAFHYENEHIAEIYYRADFTYVKDGKTIVEDVKGYSEEERRYLTTKDFNLKWKLLKCKYPNYHFQLY